MNRRAVKVKSGRSQGAVADTDITIRRLSEAAFARKGSLAKVKEWAFAHIEIPWEKIEPKSVPHPGAPRFLAWLRTAEGQRAYFSQIARKGEGSSSSEQSEEGSGSQKLIALCDVLVEEHQNAERAGPANPYAQL